MPLDVAMLESHRSYSDPVLGISERFVSLDMGTGGTLGILSSPLGALRPTGWVLCHSFGTEQMDLLVTHATIARQLAAAGYPVLRFQCQGYGESEHPGFTAGLSSHISDTVDAVSQMAELTGLDRLGLIGTRFGAAVAALAAERLTIRDLALIDPTINGSRYMNGLLRAYVMTRMIVARGRSAPDVEDLNAELDRAGILDLRGFALRKETFEENSAFDLIADVRDFTGRCLILQVSRVPTRDAGIEKLRARLGELGGQATVAAVTHPEAALFGQSHIRPVRMDVGIDQNAGHDSLADLHRSLASALIRWVDDDGASVTADRKGVEI